jgi:putative ABC transport system permease protein
VVVIEKMITAPRWQKVLSDLWGSRVRSLLVVASIAVGLFAIGIIATIYVVIASDMRTGYTAVNAANIYIQADSLDQDTVEHLRRADGVDHAEGVRTIDLRVRDSKNVWQSLHLQAVKDWASMPFNRVALKQGIWPPGTDEIVVDQYKLPDLNAKIGDLLRIEMPDGKTRELRLVGVVQDLTIGAYGGGGGFFEAPVWGFVTQDTLDQLDFPTPYDYNGLYATIQGPKDNMTLANDVTRRLTKQMEDEGITVLSSKATSAYEHPIAYLVNAIIGILFVLGLLVVFLSGFLITSTLQALLGQQVQQIGIMKSVGARWMQVAGIYMMLIFIFGLIAFAVSAPTAGSISFWLLGFLAGKMNFVLQGQRLVPAAVIIQAVLALIMPQAAAWLPIWKGTRISVQEALSGMAAGKKDKNSENEASTPARRSSRFNRVFSRPLLISLRNTFRRKGRLALTLVTLTLGGAVFISTFNVQVSMSKYIEQISQYFLSDVNVSFDQPYRIAKIEGFLYEVPGVGHVEGWAAAHSELVLPDGSSGESVNLLAPPAGSKLVRPNLISGRWIKPGDRNAIVLVELFQTRFPDLKVGDTLQLQVNGDKTNWEVVGFFRFAGKNGGYTAYTDFDYLSELTGQANRATTFQVVGNRPSLTAADQDHLAQAIEARLKDEGIQVADITTGSFLTGIAGSGFNILITFLLFLAVLTALVGSIGLTGTMSMNVMERTREIGVMRAIGASDRILMKMVLTEGLLIGAISYVLGALLAFPISKLMADGISLALFEAPSTFGFTPVGFAIWLAVVVVLSFAASVIPARNASRLTIREVLSYE